MYFVEYNIYPVLTDSHTSTWAQPNESRPNKQMHTCVETTLTRLGLIYTGKKKVIYFDNTCMKLVLNNTEARITYM